MKIKFAHSEYSSVSSFTAKLIEMYEQTKKESLCTCEIEIEYTQDISSNELRELVNFLRSSERKFLYHIKFLGESNTEINKCFTYVAEQVALHNFAQENLRTGVKISREKLDLVRESATYPATQILHVIPSLQAVFNTSDKLARDSHEKQQNKESANVDKVSLEELDDSFLVLKAQLTQYSIDLDRRAFDKIKENPSLFSDGIALSPQHLPTGLYFNENTLCYTDNPSHIPSPLAMPWDKNPQHNYLPSVDNFKLMLPHKNKIDTHLYESIIDGITNNDVSNEALFKFIKQIGASGHNNVAAKAMSLQIRPLNSLIAKAIIVGGIDLASYLLQLLLAIKRDGIDLSFLHSCPNIDL